MANKELRAAAGSAISKAAPAVSRTASAIEDTQSQVTTGIMTGNAAQARNPLNDAIGAGLGALGRRLGRGGQDAPGGPGEPAGSGAARAAAGTSETLRNAREVPLRQGGQPDDPKPNNGPDWAGRQLPPDPRNRDRGHDHGHGR